METLVPVGISNKHVHLSRKDLHTLFGQGYELTLLKELSQSGEFASKEKVDIVGDKGTLKGVRIIGPVRENSQVELSVSDAYGLGVDAPIRDSGDLDGTPGIKLVGPKGEVVLSKGVIIAARHIHMSLEEAMKFGYKDRDVVSVEVGGMRGLQFTNVRVRVQKNYRLDMHIDIEEANAAGLKNGDMVKIIDSRGFGIIDHYDDALAEMEYMIS